LTVAEREPARIEPCRSRYIDPISRAADARCMSEPSFRLSLRAFRRSATLAVEVDARGQPPIAAVALLAAAALVVVLVLRWLP
jgi:hypothetical protein